MIPIVVGCLFFFILIGVPISFGILLSGLIAVWATGSFPLYMVAQRFVSGINSFSLMAVPMFIVAGAIMSNGGISKRIFPEEGHIGRAPNVANIREYIARADEMADRKKELFLSGS